MSEMAQIQFRLRGRTHAAVEEVREGRLPKLTQALALAIHFENMVQTGEASNYAEVARMNCMSRERVSQIVRLIYLAPDIQTEALYLPPTTTGRYPISEVAARTVANILCWKEQRAAWKRLKATHQLDSRATS
jgi:hypothetical protein